MKPQVPTISLLLGFLSFSSSKDIPKSPSFIWKNWSMKTFSGLMLHMCWFTLYGWCLLCRVLVSPWVVDWRSKWLLNRRAVSSVPWCIRGSGWGHRILRILWQSWTFGKLLRHRASDLRELKRIFQACLFPSWRIDAPSPRCRTL